MDVITQLDQTKMADDLAAGTLHHAHDSWLRLRKVSYAAHGGYCIGVSVNIEPEITRRRVIALDRADFACLMPLKGVVELELSDRRLLLPQREMVTAAVESVAVRSTTGLPAALMIAAVRTRGVNDLVSPLMRPLQGRQIAWACGLRERMPSRQFYSRLLGDAIYCQDAAIRRLPGRVEVARKTFERLTLSRLVVSTDLQTQSSDMARLASMSYGHFNRCFKVCFGTTPKQHGIAFRMRLACALLECSDARLADVATNCGYDDRTAFSRAFQSFTGLSPTAFRAQRLHRNGVGNQKPVQ